MAKIKRSLEESPRRSVEEQRELYTEFKSLFIVINGLLHLYFVCKCFQLNLEIFYTMVLDIFVPLDKSRADLRGLSSNDRLIFATFCR